MYSPTSSNSKSGDFHAIIYTVSLTSAPLSEKKSNFLDKIRDSDNLTFLYLQMG